MRLRTVAALIAAVLVIAVPVPGAAAQEACEPWAVRVVATGLDRIENLEPDGRGGLFLSAGPRNAIERITPDGTRTTAFANVPSAGGLRLRGRTLYAVTNGNIVDGVTGSPNGKIETFNLNTGKRAVYSQGLTAPNGMVFDGQGNAYVSRDAGTLADPADPWEPDVFSGGIGSGMHVTKVPAESPLQPNTTWAALSDTNGLEISADGAWLYAVTTFNFNAEVYRVLLADPTVIEKIADLGGITDPANGLDDMTMGADGNLYITANGMGRVFRLDPLTGERCIIASGLQNPTAAKFGRGPGWPSQNLYVTGWDGRLLELSPPT